MLRQFLLHMVGKQCAGGGNRHQRGQIPPPRMRFQGGQERQPHGIADDHDAADALGHDLVEDVFGLETGAVIEMDRMPGKQADERRPQPRAVHERRGRQELHVEAFLHTAHEFFRGADRPAGVEIAAAAKARVEQSLVRPDDPLGHAGRAAGVEQNLVIVGELDVVE